MSPVARRLSLIAGIVAALLVAALLALPYLVSIDALRARVVRAAEESLHRKVEAGAIHLEIFSGLGAGIEKFVVRNGEGWQTPVLVSADRVSVKVAFWPLLSRRVEVRKIVIDGMTVAVERDPSGALNIADFLARPPSGGAADSKPSAAALLLARLQISRGRFLFVDRKAAPGQALTLALDDVTGEIADVSMSTAARFDLSARFLADSGRNITLKGALGPPAADRGLGDAPLQAAFGARGLALGRLRPWLGPKAADPGALSIDGTVSGALLGQSTIALNVSLAPASPSSPIPPIDGKASFALDWPAGSLVIAKSSLALAKLPLTFEGRLDELHASPRVDVRIATPGDVALDNVTGLPGLAGSLPANVRLAGRVRLAARIQGPSTDLVTQASVDAAPFAVTLDGHPVFSAPSARGTFRSRGSGPLTGKVTAPSGKLQQLSFEDLATDWSWSAGSLMLAPSARVLGGSLGARLETDLAHPGAEARVTLDVRGVNAQALVETLTAARNVLSGSLTAKMSMTSRGLTWAAISKSGRGEGTLSVADAELKTVELMPAVTRAVGAIGQVAGFRVPPGLESTRFSTLQTGLRLADGRLQTPGLSLSGRDAAATAEGSIGLDRTLAYEGRIVLGPAIVKSLGNAGRYIADAQGRLSLPFRASGPVASPKVTIDESVVVDLGRRVLARQVGERVQGPAGKILGDALEGGGGKKSDPLGALQDLLRAPAPAPTPKPTPR